VANEELAENRSRPDAPQGKPSEKLSISQFSALAGKAYFFKSQPCRTPDQQAYSGWDEQLWNLGNSILTRRRILYCLSCSIAIVLSFVRKKVHLEPVPGVDVPNGGWLAVDISGRAKSDSTTSTPSAWRACEPWRDSHRRIHPPLKLVTARNALRVRSRVYQELASRLGLRNL
jgi:hypothetical protein